MINMKRLQIFQMHHTCHVNVVITASGTTVIVLSGIVAIWTVSVVIQERTDESLASAGLSWFTSRFRKKIHDVTNLSKFAC